MGRNLRQTFHESHLYHGTPEELSPGDIILPADQVGKRPSNRGDVAYATPDIYTGNFMGWEQNNHNGKNFGEEAKTNPPKTNLYRVEPVDPTDLKRNSGVLSNATRLLGAGTVSDEVTSSAGFKVLSKVQHPQEIINKISDMNRNNPNRLGYRDTTSNPGYDTGVSLRYPSLPKQSYDARRDKELQEQYKESNKRRVKSGKKPIWP